MNYKVEIKDKKFIRKSDKKEFSQTAIITFVDKDGKETEKPEEYGLIDRSEIYNEIENNKEINISNCFVKNFSLSEYRKLRKLDKKNLIKFKNFYANETFFENGADFSYSNFIGITLFSGAKFYNGFVTFIYSKFENSVTMFSTTCFGDEDVWFIGSEFIKGLEFSGAKFGKGNIVFEDVKFKDNIDFTGTNFGYGNITFTNSSFNDAEVYFNSCIFNTGLKGFCELIINNGLLDFTGAVFYHGELSFENIQSSNCRIDLSYSKFKDVIIYFFNSRISKLSLKECNINNYINLQLKKCDYLDLSNSIFRDIINIKAGYKENVNIKKLNIIGMQNLGRINIDWKANNVKKLIKNQENETTHREKSEQFRTLKENFHKIGQYDDEDKAYVEFRKHEMRAELEDNKVNIGFKKFWNKIIINFKIFVMEKIGLYGTSPMKVMKSMVWTLLFFSIFYLLPFFKFNQIKVFSNNTILNKVLTSVYHSIVTFLTIGYGDINPANFLTVIFSGIEGFIGLFLMAYFTVAFVRKVLR